MIKKLLIPLEKITGFTTFELLVFIAMILFVIILFKRKKGERTWWK